MKIDEVDENRYSQLFRSPIFIDFRNQSINYYQLQSILSIIEFHRLGTPGLVPCTVTIQYKFVSYKNILLIKFDFNFQVAVFLT